MVTYLQLAQNRRSQGKVRAEILLSLGREDTLDRAALRRLADSINNYLDGRSPGRQP
ncbi:MULTISPECIES: hypothetical protein [unclassified Streptomyces]|uniref:Uncharacterized protein n=1 Tax=Streptomyces sp. NBC_00180 TaxID=2903632 RepID=A0AAU1ICM3_9ACTN|nr:hypothetical protein OG331_03600 [Streptomyces sp. NBC_01017]WSV34858.1 hypothetical protein OG331_48380 [Streptomyces sp. NBC_01017]